MAVRTDFVWNEEQIGSQSTYKVVRESLGEIHSKFQVRTKLRTVTTATLNLADDWPVATRY